MLESTTEIPVIQEKRLEDICMLRRQQMEHLHGVTIAINNNVASDQLFVLFKQILNKDLGIEQLSLYLHQHTWRAVLNGEMELSASGIKLAETYTLPQEIQEIHQEKLGGYQYIVPVLHKHELLAFALLGSPSKEIIEGIDDWMHYVQTLANMITMAVENKRLFKREMEKKEFDKELELASKIQSMLVPAKLPKNHFYEFSGLYLPHKSIGGDYYDVINLNKDEFLFCIGDISGKGVPAALVMANLQAYLNASTHYDMGNGRELANRLNSKIFNITNGEKFITLFMGKYNIITRQLEYLNAGHNPPILINGDETVLLDKGCTLLGIFEEIPKVEIGKVQIQPGAAIISYTDGLTELEDEEENMFGMERLLAFAQKHHRFSAEVFIKILYDNISKFKGECLFNDDVSVLVGKFY